MMRHALVVTVALALGLAAAPALAAPATYEEGETVSLSVGSLPSGYLTYWVSDRDGFRGEGNPLQDDSLTLGDHTVYAMVFQESDWTHVFTGSLDIEIVPAGRTPSPPTVTTYAPGEFEPVDDVLVACPDTYVVGDLYAQFLDALRGQARMVIYVDNTWVQNELINTFNQAGVGNTDHVFRTVPLDSIWMRDFGPLFIKEGSELKVRDLRYYPGRPNDNALPRRYADAHGLDRREVNLFWEGGNYTSDGRGNIFATDQLYASNSSMSQAAVRAEAEDAFDSQIHIFERMLDDGGTGHLDLFYLMTSHQTALLNQFPSGHQNHDRMERTNQALVDLGYTPTRVELANSRFRTYTNGVLVNGVAIVPTYNRADTDQAALDAYEAAGYTAYGVDCRTIINWGGAIHCITITVPQ